MEGGGADAVVRDNIDAVRGDFFNGVGLGAGGVLSDGGGGKERLRRAGLGAGLHGDVENGGGVDVDVEGAVVVLGCLDCRIE